MIKEIKYLIFVIIILIFVFLTGRYYFSDLNKKNSYRSFNSINQKIKIYAEKLTVLNDNTENIIEYVDQSENKKKKKFNFWGLVETNE